MVCVIFAPKLFAMIEILRQRRTIRKYLPEKIEPEKIKILQEAALRSPSSKNINPWKFLFVEEESLIGKLALCKPHGAKPLESATLAVVVCADETLNDTWVEDCSIASILLQLTAQSLGLGSCWIQVRNRQQTETCTAEEYLQQLLSIPAHFRVLSIISVGYPAQERTGRPAEELEWEKISTNRF